MRPQYLILAEASVTESTASAMDTMMTVLYLGCGFYCLLLWFRLRRGAPISAGKSILIPGGFGSRGVEGKCAAIKWARERKVPLLGICLGMQCCVI